MILENINCWHGEKVDIHINNTKVPLERLESLTAFPAVIDPHVHFRTPGLEYKEDWRHAAKAALRGGCTYVFDMPNTLPPTITEALLEEKKKIIDKQLQEVNIPLRYQLFFGADKNHLEQLSQVKNQVIGVKVFMGCSTGNLVIDDDESLDKVFSIAAKEELLVAVHAEDEALIQHRKHQFADRVDYPAHSEMRTVEVALRAVKKAIDLVRKYGTRLYILHVSTQAEVELIRQAKQEGLPVYAETTPHHLFFDTSCYAKLKGKGVVNPPLRSKADKGDLFAAIEEGVIDSIGSDHAPHALEEKEKSYGQCPSGMPGIEFVLPMLLNAYHENKITLEKIVDITSGNARRIFKLNPGQDWVLVDLAYQATIEATLSKCGWSSYEGLTLRGWPVYTVCHGEIFLANNNEFVCPQPDLAC